MGSSPALIAEAAETIPEPTAPMPFWRRPASRSTLHRSLHRSPRSAGTTRLRDLGARRRGSARHLDRGRSVLVLFAPEHRASWQARHRHSGWAPPAFGRGQTMAGVTRVKDTSSASQHHPVGKLAKDHHHRHALARRPRACARSRRRRAAGDRDVAGRVRLDLQCGPRRLESWWHRGARCSRWRIPKSGERGRVTRHLEAPEHDRDRRDRSGRADLGAQVSALEAARRSSKRCFARAGTSKRCSRSKTRSRRCKARSNSSRHNNAFSRTRSALEPEPLRSLCRARTHASGA